MSTFFFSKVSCSLTWKKQEKFRFLFEEWGKNTNFPKLEKKINYYKSVIKYKHKCKWLNFSFLSCWVSSSFNILFSLGSKNAILTQKLFYRNMSFTDPDNDGILKSAPSIELPGCCNSFFFWNTRLNFFNQVYIGSTLHVQEQSTE